ncbi:hypothetical protein BH09PLA1_BH09PLA1_19680 [soil metagenome]
MSELNPFVGAILPSAAAQRAQSAERVNQVRRGQEAKKIAGQQGSDFFEHQVESTDAVGAVHEDDAHPDQKRKPRNRRDRDESSEPTDEESRGIDLTA